MSLIVKICGLSTRETLDVALQAGADMVGFVFFPPSPRHISLEIARELGRQARGRATRVALTVDVDDATLANIVDALQPDVLQVHGRETVARLRRAMKRRRAGEEGLRNDGRRIKAYFNLNLAPVQMAAVVSITMVSVCTWASFVGGLLPVLAKRIGIDPAVVSAPLITTLVDATGLVIYFLIARAILL